jgi:hypothetical protein
MRFATDRCWRTLAATSPEAAQVRLDRFWSTPGDARRRSPSRIDEPSAAGSRPRWPSVGELADTEDLAVWPTLPFPATIAQAEPVDFQASVAFGGHRYRGRCRLVPGRLLRMRHRRRQSPLGPQRCEACNTWMPRIGL